MRGKNASRLVRVEIEVRFSVVYNYLCFFIFYFELNAMFGCWENVREKRERKILVYFVLNWGLWTNQILRAVCPSILYLLSFEAFCECFNSIDL